MNLADLFRMSFLSGGRNLADIKGHCQDWARLLLSLPQLLGNFQKWNNWSACSSISFFKMPLFLGKKEKNNAGFYSNDLPEILQCIRR